MGVSLDVRRIDQAGRATLQNLLDHYCHDMAEWFQLDAEADGNYAYARQRAHCARLAAYIAWVQGIPIGFALVGSAAARVDGADGHDLDAFFVVRRHRRAGVGQVLAQHVWALYPGNWLVRVYRGNEPALPFWRAAIAAQTGGRFREVSRDVAARRWSYFSFEVPAARATPVSPSPSRI